jgi:hypothetical protein
MDFFEIILGRGLIQIIGGLIRYILHYIYSLFMPNVHRNSLSFYFKDKKDETFNNSDGNHVVGVIFFFIIVLIIIVVMSPAGRKFFN